MLGTELPQVCLRKLTSSLLTHSGTVGCQSPSHLMRHHIIYSASCSLESKQIAPKGWGKDRRLEGKSGERKRGVKCCELSWLGTPSTKHQATLSSKKEEMTEIIK